MSCGCSRTSAWVRKIGVASPTGKPVARYNRSGERRFPIHLLTDLFARPAGCREQHAARRDVDGIATVAAGRGPLWQAHFIRAGRSFGMDYNLIGHRPRVRGGQWVHLAHRASPTRSSITGLTFYPEHTDLSKTFGGRLLVPRHLGVSATSRPAGPGRSTLSLHGAHDAQRRMAASEAGIYFETYGYDPSLYSNYYLGAHRRRTTRRTRRSWADRLIPNTDYVLQVTTPQFSTFDLDCSKLGGRDENFFEWSAADIGVTKLTVNWRPTDKMRAQLTYNAQIYWRHSDGSVVERTLIPRLDVEYQLSRPIFFRLVGQYDAAYQDSLRDDSRTNLPIFYRDPGRGIFTRASAVQQQPVPGLRRYSRISPFRARSRSSDTATTWSSRTLPFPHAAPDGGQFLREIQLSLPTVGGRRDPAGGRRWSIFSVWHTSREVIVRRVTTPPRGPSPGWPGHSRREPVVGHLPLEVPCAGSCTNIFHLDAGDKRSAGARCGFVATLLVVGMAGVTAAAGAQQASVAPSAERAGGTGNDRDAEYDRRDARAGVAAAGDAPALAAATLAPTGGPGHINASFGIQSGSLGFFGVSVAKLIIPNVGLRAQFNFFNFGINIRSVTSSTARAFALRTSLSWWHLPWARGAFHVTGRVVFNRPASRERCESDAAGNITINHDTYRRGRSALCPRPFAALPRRVTRASGSAHPRGTRRSGSSPTSV